MHRRDFLRSSAALAALLGLPLPAAAAGSDRRFLFVFAEGGWDPTRVLAPVFGTAAAMEPDAVEATTGELAWVDHPDRPSVRAFFEAHHASSAILNGILVPSVAHDACTKLLMTGSSDDELPDWAAVLASESDGLLLPHLVTSGPSFAGPYGTEVVRTGLYGQLGDLVRPGPISGAGSDAIDRVLARRSRTAPEAFDAALQRLPDLRALDGTLDLAVDPSFARQADLALDALATGTSRCVTMSSGGLWDTHTANDTQQSVLWEDLFAGLLELAGGLVARGLDQDTTVVVLSEMGRTPVLNADLGKDHWPYTSVLLFGAGVRSGVVGGFDDQHEGVEVDGQVLSTNRLGATLLALADVDPGERLPGVQPVEALLRP